jgi:hypothetical protein
VATGETENNRGTVRYGDFYEGRVEVIKSSGFVNSNSRGQSEISEMVVRDSSESFVK